jgi:peptidoglycan/LPS O-acetylase OafA/YrhL
MMAYRTDIDGLRAVAVLLVVLYHFIDAPRFNGYMGVDVFFVISGYLITTIINKDIENRQFSYTYFYKKRIKRLFPALSAVLLVSVTASYFLLLPTELEALSNSAIFGAVFSSNFLFYTESGYFDASADLKPLLHTWSLAIEEQFYLIFPFVFVLLKTKSTNTDQIKVLVIVAIIISFLLSLILELNNDRSASFYLFPARAWELLCGTLLAITASHKRRITPAQTLCLYGAGVIAIGIGLSPAYSNDLPLCISVLPVIIGTTLMIYAGNTTQTDKLSRVLDIVGLTWIGKISYSLYLWHWPIYVLSKYYMLDHLSRPLKLSLIGLSIGVSYLSWRFIEQPARQQNGPLIKSPYIQASITALLITLAICLNNLLNGGITFWHDEETLRLTNVSLGVNEQVQLESFNSKSDFLFGSPGSIDKASVLVIGDSHALAITPLVDMLARNDNKTALFLDHYCFVPNGFSKQLPAFSECSTRSQAIINYINTSKNIQTIIIALRWVARTEDWLRHHQVPKEHYLLLRERTLSEFITSIEGTEKDTLVWAQVPLIEYKGQNSPSIYARMLMHKDPNLYQLYPTLKKHLEQQRNMIPILNSIEKNTGATVIWPHKKLCDEVKKQCQIMDDGGFYYYDDDHLSRYGALHLAPLLTPYL